MNNTQQLQVLAAAVKTTREAVEAERTKLTEWESTKAATQAELEDLQKRAGTEVLDAPDSATGLARAMQGLRDQVDIAERAVDAQGPRVIAAEQAYLTAEADQLEATVLAPAQKALDKHQARTEELLAELEQHEGRYVPETELLVARHQTGIDGPLTVPATKGGRLRAEVTRASQQVQVLRKLAEGNDPQPLIDGWVTWNRSRGGADVYAPCVWGPGALVPAGEYLRQLEAARQRAAELEEVARWLPGQISGLERRQAEEPPHVELVDLHRKRERGRTLPDDQAAAARRVAELEGA